MDQDEARRISPHQPLTTTAHHTQSAVHGMPRSISDPHLSGAVEHVFIPSLLRRVEPETAAKNGAANRVDPLPIHHTQPRLQSLHQISSGIRRLRRSPVAVCWHSMAKLQRFAVHTKVAQLEPRDVARVEAECDSVSVLLAPSTAMDA